MGFAYKPLEPGQQVTIILFNLRDQIIMANKSDRLVKIGLEGFAMIDEIYVTGQGGHLPLLLQNPNLTR